MSFLTKRKWSRPVLLVLPEPKRSKMASLQSERWKLLLQIAAIERQIAKLQLKIRP